MRARGAGTQLRRAHRAAGAALSSRRGDIARNREQARQQWRQRRTAFRQDWRNFSSKTRAERRAFWEDVYHHHGYWGHWHGHYHGDDFWWGFAAGAFLGAAVASIPPYYTTVYYAGIPYAYYGGVYYQTVPSGGYVIVQPPVGVVVEAPPPECSLVEAGDLTLCYHYGTFYQWDPEIDGYRVVSPPVGVVVTYLPDEAEERYTAHSRYYFHANVWYRSVYQGATLVYQVVRPPT